jgi:vancomycin resistance protein YoaR
MNETQTAKFKALITDLESLDDECRTHQKSLKNNPYHAMISDAKSVSILVSESYKHYLDAKRTNASVEFYDVMIDLLERKVKVLAVMVGRWF